MGSIMIKAGFLVMVVVVASISPEPQELKVHPGQEAVLQCLTPKPTTPSLLVWVRPDLESEGYVYFRRGTKPSHWHPSYDGRVELKDPEMKDGDISVILKNVTFTDSGRYECQIVDVSTEDGPRLICTIILKVEHSGHTGGHKDGGDQDGGDQGGGDQDGGDQGGHVGLIVAVVLFLAFVVGLVFYRKHQSQIQRAGFSPAAC